MRLIAHVRSDGSIHSLVAQAEGDVQAMLMPDPGIEVCEITDHDLDENIDFERLEQLRQEYLVEVTPARGRLVPRGGKSAS